MDDKNGRGTVVTLILEECRRDTWLQRLSVQPRRTDLGHVEQVIRVHRLRADLLAAELMCQPHSA